MKETLTWVETARTILMAGVVLVHANIYTGTDPRDWWPAGYWSILGLGVLVPAFFAISGFVLAHGHPPDAPLDRGRFLRSRLLTMVVPFLAWSAVMLAVALALGEVTLGQEISWAGALLFFFTGYWHLYFVFALLQLLVLFAALHRRLHGARLRWVLVSAGLCTLAFYGLASLLLWTGIRQDQLFENWLDRLFAGWCLYFFLGVWLRRSPRVLAALGRYWWLLAAVTAGLFVPYLREVEAEQAMLGDTPLLQFLLSGLPFQALGALAFLGLFKWLGDLPRAARLLSWIARPARYTFGVYLCHNLILVLLWSAWKRAGFPTDPAVAIPILWLVTAAAAFALTWAGRYLWWPGRILFAIRKVAPSTSAAGGR